MQKRSAYSAGGSAEMPALTPWACERDAALRGSAAGGGAEEAVGVSGSEEGAVAEAEEQPLHLPAERVALEHVDYAEKVDALAVRRRNAALLEQRRQPAAAAIDAVDADEQRVVERAC